MQLRCNRQQLLDEKTLSDEIKQENGVAQGDILPLLLFSVFNADLYHGLKPDELEEISYADDLFLDSRNHYCS